MKRSLLLPAVLPAVLAAAHTFAAAEFDADVPREVVEQVMGAMFGSQFRLYRDLPDGFPAFAMPRDMTLIASVDQGYSQRVILKSQFDPQAATALAYGALLDSGWDLVPMPGMQQPQTGFINPFQPVPPTQLCHDEHGVMQVSAQVGSGATYVNMTRNIVPPGVQMPGCGPQQPVDPMPDMYRQLQDQMPRLQLPSTGGMSSSGGYGGSGGPNEWEVRATMNGPWELERAYTYFVEQIEQQGWEQDTSAIGASMATGSWTKTVDDVDFVGNLIVLMTDENAYDLRFRLVRRGQANAGAFGVFRSTTPMIAPALGIRGLPTGSQMIPQRGNSAPIGVTEIVRD